MSHLGPSRVEKSEVGHEQHYKNRHNLTVFLNYKRKRCYNGIHEW